uniref:3-ketodihydrosphingosine reductase n=1 Tax=Cacopsylla melanoneura TaxID=428564 RepID=A0A8D9EWA0_9HEMI
MPALVCLAFCKSLVVIGTTILIFLVVLKKITNLVFRAVDKHSISGKHVLITGGSSGIGKAVAIEAIKRGAHVTIIARDEKKLLKAVEELKQAVPNPKFTQFVEYVSVDISKDYEKIREALVPAQDKCGPVYMLINCAGMALCGTLEQMSMQDIKTVIDLNLYGTIHVTKALIEGMKQRGRGDIVVTASQAANLGIYGLAAYTSSKFALKGFAEALYMERGNYFSTLGLESFMLTTLSAGMSPIVNIQDTLIQAFLMGPLRIVAIYLHFTFDNIVKKCRKAQ